MIHQMDKPSLTQMIIDTPEYMTTSELAELLRIKERKVYEMVSSGKIPCTRATGKLLFARREIDSWLGEKGGSKSAHKATHMRPAVFLGSHDPLLDWALKESACGLASNFDGSMDGLDRFAAGEGLAAAMHLYEGESSAWNTRTVSEKFTGQAVVLGEFCWRERGLVMRTELKDQVQSITDLKGHSIAPRQASAGSQLLLLHLMEQQGLDAGDVSFSELAYTETDAVTSILDGSADATLGLRSVARRFNLEFVPLMRERFDLLVDRRAWFEPAFQAFLSFCRSAAFRERAKSLQGYDVSGFGKVHFTG